MEFTPLYHRLIHFSLYSISYIPSIDALWTGSFDYCITYINACNYVSWLYTHLICACLLCAVLFFSHRHSCNLMLFLYLSLSLRTYVCFSIQIVFNELFVVLTNFHSLISTVCVCSCVYMSICFDCVSSRWVRCAHKQTNGTNREVIER